MPTEALRDHARYLVENAPVLAPASELRLGFEQARLIPGPWLDAIGSPLALAGLGTLTLDNPPDVLADSDWIALQNICRS